MQVREHRDESIATPETSTNSKAMAEIVRWKDVCHFGRCFGVFCQAAFFGALQKIQYRDFDTTWSNLVQHLETTVPKSYWKPSARCEAVLQKAILIHFDPWSSWSDMTCPWYRRLAAPCGPCEVGHLTVRQPRGIAWSYPTWRSSDGCFAVEWVKDSLPSWKLTVRT